MRLSPCVLVQPDGWARGEREGYGEPCDVTSLSLNSALFSPRGIQPILDPDADRLFNAIQVMNLGNNRTQWHNTCQRAVSPACASRRA